MGQPLRWSCGEIAFRCWAGTAWKGFIRGRHPVRGVLSPRRLEIIAAGASLGAGAVHGALVREHFLEWWGYGLFFAFAALGQLLFGLALLTDAVNERDTG